MDRLGVAIMTGQGKSYKNSYLLVFWRSNSRSSIKLFMFL